MKKITDYAELVKAKHALNKTIAPVEDGANMAGSYTTGQQFIRDGVLYTALTSIAASTAFSSLTLDTDYEVADDITSQLSSVNSALSNKTTPLTATLAQGETSVTIQDARITTSSTFLPVSETFGLAPTAISVTTGQIVMTYDAQAQAENVGVLVY